MNLSPDELCRLAYALRVLGNTSMDEDGDDVLIDKLEKIIKTSRDAGNCYINTRQI